MYTHNRTDHPTHQWTLVGPIPWGHTGPLGHALSLLLLSWTSHPYLQVGLTNLDEIWHDGRSKGVASPKNFW